MLLRRTPLLIAAVLLLTAPTALAQDDEFEPDLFAGYLSGNYTFAAYQKLIPTACRR